MLLTHAPARQASFVVQVLLSSHGAVLFVEVHVPSPSHESSVHTLLSLQVYGVPAQTPPEHVSVCVHALPSLHVLELLT